VHVIETAAAALTAILGWAVFVLVSPYRECRWCRDKPRRRGCWRCKGTKLTRRFGAWPVHKVKLSLIQAWDERAWWR
jgi:hypothetical protein